MSLFSLLQGSRNALCVRPDGRNGRILQHTCYLQLALRGSKLVRCVGPSGNQAVEREEAAVGAAQATAEPSKASDHMASDTSEKSVLEQINDTVRFSSSSRRKQCPPQKQTKWAVSAAVFAVLLWYHNNHAAWSVTGSILSSYVCKVVKAGVNQARPASAQKADPGMPSSHANSIGFLSWTAATAMLIGSPPGLLSSALASAVLLLGVGLTSLRWILGFHTLPQVVVGYLLGSGQAILWQSWWQAPVKQMLIDSPSLGTAMDLVAVAAVISFVAFGVVKWFQEGGPDLLHAKRD